MKVLVDAMNIVFMNFHLAKKQLGENGEELNEENKGIFYHYFLNKVNTFFEQYDDIVFCWEGKGSTAYRKSIFPDYKMNRKDKEMDDGIKFMLSEIKNLKNILRFYPCKQMEVAECEADDVIYSLCKKYHKEDNILVLTSDGDLSQLMEFFPDSVEVYNPIFRKYITVKENVVLEKAICGDKSDNIPGLFRVGKKTFEKMLKDEKEWNKVLNKENNQKIFESFLKIVDLREYPKHLQERILKTDEEINYSEFKPQEIEKFLFDNKMRNLLDRWSRTKSKIWQNKGILEDEFVQSSNALEELKNEDRISAILSMYC